MRDNPPLERTGRGIILVCGDRPCGRPLNGKYVMHQMSDDTDNNLASRCREYLAAGPPAHMTNYAPESLTEIIIAHGAESRPLDPELREIGSLILLESPSFDSYDDAAIRDYMKRGAALVAEVLSRPSADA